ncbi:MAG: class I SAM-dependent methyltransferase [Anaerolineae bacterium]|nr:class I SAM-dependent methyltransferase [Anaerolineae bacterium]
MTETMLKINTLHQLSQAPEPFTPGEPLFWDDPHISKMMLDAHLNPETEAASRPPEIIDAIVDWLITALDLEPGAAWLDMGCGPGLYTSRLARRGLSVTGSVTGIDYSRRSIAYAQDYAAEHNLTIEYRYQNYLTLEDTARYDVVSLIYGDFCPLSPENRASLLARVHRALKPGGRFVLDVTTPVLRARWQSSPRWDALPEGGFWKPGPHLVLERGFAYPDDVYVNQYIVIEPDGTQTVYRNWFQDYTPERITDEITAGGFAVSALWGDLTGTPYTAESDWIAIVAARAWPDHRAGVNHKVRPCLSPAHLFRVGLHHPFR